LALVPTSPNALAALNIVSTTKGLLIPRISEATRTAMVAPPAGLLVYQANGSQPGFWCFATVGGWPFLNPTGTGDNLGNHTATQNLNLAPFRSWWL
jgi:hypothetical protein